MRIRNTSTRSHLLNLSSLDYVHLYFCNYVMEPLFMLLTYKSNFNLTFIHTLLPCIYYIVSVTEVKNVLILHDYSLQSECFNS